MAVGRYVGSAFTDFVGGDLLKWSETLWNTYNSLKHAPNFEYDPYDIFALGESGALLLQGALLNRVAGNKKVMEAICNSHRTHNLMHHVRKVVNR
jgi:hypothetical protein